MNKYLMKSSMYRKFKFEQGEDEYSCGVAAKKGTELVFVTAQYKPGSPRAGTTQVH
jgi:hypothetical protein